ncbi:hypothetical protein BDZ91DRAFT_108938 [Kalaharituber pfeilii]|nr:hypothetical protein BDZ91DRAFT_108938 [Kalaharituber pfeilii]
MCTCNCYKLKTTRLKLKRQQEKTPRVLKMLTYLDRKRSRKMFHWLRSLATTHLGNVTNIHPPAAVAVPTAYSSAPTAIAGVALSKRYTLALPRSFENIPSASLRPSFSLFWAHHVATASISIDQLTLHLCELRSITTTS